MDAVLDADSRTRTMQPTEVPLHNKKFAIAEHTHRRLVRPNRSTESAVRGPQRRSVDLHSSITTSPWRPSWRRSMELKAFQHQRRIRRQQRTFVRDRFGTELDNRPES